MSSGGGGWRRQGRGGGGGWTKFEKGEGGWKYRGECSENREG